MLSSISSIHQSQVSSQSQCSKLTNCIWDSSIASFAVITFGTMAVYQNTRGSCQKMLEELGCYETTCYASYVERCLTEYNKSSRLFNYYLAPLGMATFCILKLVKAKAMTPNEQVRHSRLSNLFKRIIYNEQSRTSIRMFGGVAAISLLIRISLVLFPDFFPNPQCQAEQGPFCSIPSTSCTSVIYNLPEKVCDLSDSINNIDSKAYMFQAGWSLLMVLLAITVYRAHIKIQPSSQTNSMPASSVNRTTVLISTPATPPYYGP